MSNDGVPLQPLSPSQREVLEQATASYSAAMTPAGAKFLLARGIDRDTAMHFRLGIVHDKPYPGHSRFRGFMSIPYLDKMGGPLSLRYRCLQEHDHRSFGHGKYLSMSHEPMRVFNVRGIHTADNTIHIAEGEFDTMILSKVFGGCSAGFPGASSWKPHHRRMLAGFNRVYVWADPDDAGAEFAQRVCRQVRQAKGVRLTTGDVTDTYIKGGADALTSLIEKEDHP